MYDTHPFRLRNSGKKEFSSIIRIDILELLIDKFNSNLAAVQLFIGSFWQK